MLILKYQLQETEIDINKHNTPAYFSTMDIDVKNIDKNDKNTWITIYEPIDEPYFWEVKIFTKVFIYHCKKNPKYPQEIPS